MAQIAGRRGLPGPSDISSFAARIAWGVDRERQRRIAEATHLPQCLTAIVGQRVEGIGVGQFLDRGTRHARSNGIGLAASVGRYN